MRGELCGFHPRLLGNLEVAQQAGQVSMRSMAVDDAVEIFHGEPSEDLAKHHLFVGISLAVALAAVINLPVSAHVSAHTISGAVAGMAAVALLGNEKKGGDPLFGGSFGASMNKHYHNLVPLMDAAINKGVLCGTYAAACGAFSVLAPGAPATLCVVGSAATTALASTATEMAIDRNIAEARELRRAYLLSRQEGVSRLAALRQLWAQRRTRDAGGTKAFWSATKLNVWGFEVFYLSWNALTNAAPWIGATVPGHAVGAAIAVNPLTHL